ncbi:MAG: protein-glutamate O-methyltransferase CheR [Lachnospiraceae bacterium]|nr:protein-glutamate O-methyltransferase CheR [Lachnospiraceae bacterium]
MTDEEFRRIYQLLKSKYGIDMSAKKEIVKGRLENFLRLSKYETYTEFINAMELDITGTLEGKMVDMLTTNHTYFFREPEHFDYLREVVLPELKKRENVNRDLCIWSAACSSGEEPYTLAMIIGEFFGLERDRWDTKVLATDISKEVLDKAARGIYTENQVKELPEHFKRYYFRQVEGTDKYEVKDFLKQEVIFREFNLMNPLPFKRKMHVVFLRNVMIYFDVETKKKLIKKIYDGMEDGGYLFIGKTETIDREDCPFRMIRSSIYKKQQGR